jgi:hypothetical protein
MPRAASFVEASNLRGMVRPAPLHVPMQLSRYRNLKTARPIIRHHPQDLTAISNSGIEPGCVAESHIRR